mmetsp:Transcript_41143/g.122045  ORF Transcript_41143/g.122045 Transcript_41143/m.122045 type:complete len:220 (-) Transcript_41143:298-957(-)
MSTLRPSASAYAQYCVKWASDCIMSCTYRTTMAGMKSLPKTHTRPRPTFSMAAVCRTRKPLSAARRPLRTKKGGTAARNQARKLGMPGTGQSGCPRHVRASPLVPWIRTMASTMSGRSRASCRPTCTPVDQQSRVTLLRRSALASSERSRAPCSTETPAPTRGTLLNCPRYSGTTRRRLDQSDDAPWRQSRSGAQPAMRAPRPLQRSTTWSLSLSPTSQ